MSPIRSTRPTPAAPLTETVDPIAGRIQVSGHLTMQGADLLRGTVESLRRQGHARVVLDLAGVGSADESALPLLQDLCGGGPGSVGRVLLLDAD